MARNKKSQDLAIRICHHYDKIAHGNRKLTYQHFVKKEGVSKTTICRILNKYDETGTAIYIKPTGPPPKVMTPQVILQVARAYQEDPSVSVRNLAKRLNIKKTTLCNIKRKVAKLNLQKYNEAHGIASSNLGSPDIGPGSPAQVSPKYIEVNCTICCQNINNYENTQDTDIPTSSTDIISQTICKLFGIQDDFESLTSASSYCTNCSSIILKIHKIWQELDEAKLQLEEIIIKNAAGTSAGNFILDQNQNSNEMARNEIIKRIKPSVNPEAAAVKLEDNEKGLNENHDLDNDPPDWNLFDDDAQDYIEKTDESQEHLNLELDHNEAEEFYFYLKTPVLKLTKLPQSLINHLTQKNVDLQAIQNEIDLHLQKDHQNQIINKSAKSSIVNFKMKFVCAKCGKSYSHKKDLKSCYNSDHVKGNSTTRKQLSKDNSILGKKVRSHLCHLCSRSFFFSIHLDRHLKSHSRETFKCPVPDCIKTFKSNDDLQDHANVHNNVQVHKCPVDHCDGVFSTKSQLTSHLYLHGKFKGKFNCALCSSSFGFAKNLLSHKNEVHNYIENPEIMCEICAKVCINKNSYNKHKYKYHESSRKLINFEKKQCPICKAWFKIGFEQHMNIHRQLALT